MIKEHKELLGEDDNKDPGYTTGDENYDEFRRNFVYKPGEYDLVKNSREGMKGRYQSGRLNRLHPNSNIADQLVILGHCQRTKQLPHLDFKLPTNPEEFRLIEEKVKKERKESGVKVVARFKKSKKSYLKHTPVVKLIENSIERNGQ